MEEQQLSVLLIEDDEDDYIFVRNLLSKIPGTKYTIEWVKERDTALEALERGCYDVCLLDYRLDRYDGLKLLKTSMQGGCTIPVIFLTGQGDYSVDVEAMKAGAADYLVKSHLSAPLLERSIRYTIERRHAQSALRESEQRYRFLAEKVEQFIWTADPDGMADYCNQYWTTYTGLSVEASRGEGWSASLHPDDIAWTMDRWRNARKTGVGFEIEYRFRRSSDGRYRWFYGCIAPIRDESGRVVKWIGTAVDIDDKKRLEEALDEERKRLFFVLEMLPAFVYLHGPDHTIRYANNRFREIFGDPEGKLCYEVLKKHQEPCPSCSIQEVLSGRKAVTSEWSADDGRIYQIYDSLFYDIDGSPLVLEVGFDITDRRQSEEQLRYLSSKLLSAQEEERKRIARELHDSIGSSLTAVKFGLENTLSVMSKGAASPALLETLVHTTQRAIDEARRIMADLRPSLIDDLGIIATIDWFCRQSQTIYPDLHIRKDVQVEEQEIPEALKITIFRVLQESLSNAAKYSRAEEVSVSLYRQGDLVELKIEDNGMGFDVDDVLRRRTNASGLGLTSMKERTELSGGTFSIQSLRGQGTVIHAMWPCHVQVPVLS